MKITEIIQKQIKEMEETRAELYRKKQAIETDILKTEGGILALHQTAQTIKNGGE